MRMPSYRRSLGAMISDLTGTGFAVEQIVEPRPIEELENKEPGEYELLSRRPGFMCARARAIINHHPELNKVI